MPQFQQGKGASRQLLRISCIVYLLLKMLKLRIPSLTWPATCSSMRVTTWPLAQPWKGMSAARMTVRVSANSCRHISRAVCRSRVSCHVSRVPATHLALLLLEVGPLLLLLGLQHHLGTRHLLALPRPAATIRYDDTRSGIRGPSTVWSPACVCGWRHRRFCRSRHPPGWACAPSWTCPEPCITSPSSPSSSPPTPWSLTSSRWHWPWRGWRSSSCRHSGYHSEPAGLSTGSPRSWRSAEEGTLSKWGFEGQDSLFEAVKDYVQNG